MTKNLTLKPIQKLYRNWTENQIRGLGQFLVKTWSAFLIKGLQPSGKMRVENFRQHCGKVSVVLELPQAKNTKKLGIQKVDKNRTDLLYQDFTETSSDLEGLILESCRQSDGKMSVVFYPSFVLFPHVGEYIRKSPFQFAIPSSYLYGVVFKKLCL